MNTLPLFSTIKARIFLKQIGQTLLVKPRIVALLTYFIVKPSISP
jgi:hypothetical protein